MVAFPTLHRRRIASPLTHPPNFMESSRWCLMAILTGRWRRSELSFPRCAVRRWWKRSLITCTLSFAVKCSASWTTWNFLWPPEQIRSTSALRRAQGIQTWESTGPEWKTFESCSIHNKRTCVRHVLSRWFAETGSLRPGKLAEELCAPLKSLLH